jgi:5-methylcytosine-specific restriction protein A
MREGNGRGIGQGGIPYPPLTSGRRKMQATEEWIKELIVKGDMHSFYASSAWTALAARVREQQHNECQRCKNRGYYVPCDVVHHKQYVKKRPDMALDEGNLECLCRECHEEEHKRKRPMLNEEKW